MCGIVAVVEGPAVSAPNEHLLSRMTDALRHRGPDGGGYKVIGRCGLGHRRLSIIDLSETGRQPMTNADETLWLTYNGEIYNYQDIRRELESKGCIFRSQSDSEVILQAYTTWGTDCLKRFNGMFAFALWDVPKQALFVARDRLGIKPLVYSATKDHFACASELNALLLDPHTPRELDKAALHHYLSLMNVPAPFTIYQNVYKLLPGHYLMVQDCRVSDTCYWHLDLHTPATDSAAHLLDELEAALERSVGSQLVADVEVASYLSGGVDSSIVSALAIRRHPGLRTFSVSFPGAGQLDEGPHARQVAEYIDSVPCEIVGDPGGVSDLPAMVRHFGEPFAVSSVMPLYWMSRETSKYVKVVLSGDGGDEVFGGYPWRHSILDQRWDAFPPLPGIRHDWPGSPIRWGMSRWNKLASWGWGSVLYGREQMRDWAYIQQLMTLTEAEKRFLYTDAWAEQLRDVSTDTFLMERMPAHGPDRLARWLTFDMRTTLPDEMLSKVDRASMAWGLEVRVPYLDHTLVEFALRIPASLKVQGAEGKVILKRLGERLLPRDLLYRPKQGFTTPLNAWFRGDLRALIEDILSERNLRDGGILNPTAVSELVTRQRTDQTQNYSNRVFTLLAFELWRQTKPGPSTV